MVGVGASGGAVKFTIFVTRECNLNCCYCYLDKESGTAMSRATADRVVDFIYRHASPDERISIGFFGGEPLLEPVLLGDVATMIEDHPDFDPFRVEMAVVSNGTRLTGEIENLLARHHMSYFVSCDGAPQVHDANRRYVDGSGSALVVERNLRRAIAQLPRVAVNAVIHPKTLRHLPNTVQYFMGLGLREIHLSPDLSAQWTKTDLAVLPRVLATIGELYSDAFRAVDPVFINIIDSKIAVMLRGGFQPAERCRMGTGELAFTPSGRIYGCERLVGNDTGGDHCLGSVDSGIDLKALSCQQAPGAELNEECGSCAVRDLCMNWCGCSNYFATGFYNRVNAFQCEFERTTIAVALELFQKLHLEFGTVFVEHLAGRPESGVALRRQLPIVDQVAPERGWKRPGCTSKEA